MDGKTFVRLVAVIFVAIAVTAAALEMTRKQESPAGMATAVPAPSAPLRKSLRRCQGLGEAALRDDDCMHMWAEQRDRFLGLTAPSGSSISGPPAPRSQHATRPEAR